MNILFFISLIAVSVMSNPLAPLMANPKAFVASLQNADPETINKMLELVARLVQEGIDMEAAALADAQGKRAVSDKHAKELSDAETALNKAQGELESATGTRNELIGAEAIHKAALDKATADRDASQADYTKKQGLADDVAARVAHENEEFAEVLALLDSIVVPASEFIGRSLLSKADPDAIEKVKGEVQALIDNANAEDAAHAASAAAASDKLATDSQAYDTALNTHTDTAGKLQSACILVEQNTAIRDTAQVAKDAASRQAYLSEVDATDAEAFHASEVTRVANEDATLKEVDELLRALLPEEF